MLNAEVRGQLVTTAAEADLVVRLDSAAVITSYQTEKILSGFM